MSIFADLNEVAARVRSAMQDGPVTPYYSLPLKDVYAVLQAALASEIICVLRYQQHYYMTTSLHQNQLQEVFKEHWHDEQDHQERIADRLQQLGGGAGLQPHGRDVAGLLDI